jgi:hypothetical protein
MLVNFEKTMNRNFLVTPPELNKAFESDARASGCSSEMTRRSFVKRAGAASVATLVALSLGLENARAQTGALSSGSGSGLVLGSPGAPTGYHESPLVNWSDCSAKWFCYLAPESGVGSTVTVTAAVQAWKTSNYSGTVSNTQFVTLYGSSDGTAFTSTFTGSAPNGYATNWVLDKNGPGSYAYTAMQLAGGSVNWERVKAHLEIMSDVTSGDKRTITGLCYLVKRSILRDFSGTYPVDISDNNYFSPSQPVELVVERLV